jgi:hypothetical protein
VFQPQSNKKREERGKGKKKVRQNEAKPLSPKNMLFRDPGTVKL